MRSYGAHSQTPVTTANQVRLLLADIHCSPTKPGIFQLKNRRKKSGTSLNAREVVESADIARFLNDLPSKIVLLRAGNKHWQACISHSCVN